MADQVTYTPQITSDRALATDNVTEKIKDPKKVEQGKKLAAISKAAKEKARKKTMTENRMVETDSWNIDYGYAIGTVGVITAVGALYFAYRQDRATKDTVPCDRQPTKDQTNMTDVAKTVVHRAPATATDRIEMFD